MLRQCKVTVRDTTKVNTVTFATMYKIKTQLSPTLVQGRFTDYDNSHVLRNLRCWPTNKVNNVTNDTEILFFIMFIAWHNSIDCYYPFRSKQEELILEDVHTLLPWNFLSCWFYLFLFSCFQSLWNMWRVILAWNKLWFLPLSIFTKNYLFQQ